MKKNTERQEDGTLNDAGHKLDRAQKREVVGLLATGYSPEYIAQEVGRRYEISISPQNIRRTYVHGKRWQKLLGRIRTKMDAEVMKHPLASKINRLNILMETISEAREWQDSKVTYDSEGNRTERIQKKPFSVIASLLKEARAEIEGDQATTPQLLQKITIINSTEQGDRKAKAFQDKLSGRNAVFIETKEATPEAEQ